MKSNKISVKYGVFGACPISILQDERITPNALRVYIALMSYQGTEDECFPTREKIAVRAGLNFAEKVSHALRILKDTGWVVVIQRGKKQSNVYRCCFVDITENVISEISDVPETVTGDVPETVTSIVKDHLKDHIAIESSYDNSIACEVEKSTYSTDETKALIKHSFGRNRDDIVHTEPLPAPAAPRHVAKKAISGQYTKTPKLSPDEKIVWDYAKDIFSRGYIAINKKKLAWDGCQGSFLSKIVKTGITCELFMMYASEFYKSVFKKDDMFKGVTFDPKGFYYKTSILDSRLGGWTDEEKKAATNGTATKDIWDKVHMK